MTASTEPARAAEAAPVLARGAGAARPEAVAGVVRPARPEARVGAASSASPEAGAAVASPAGPEAGAGDAVAGRGRGGGRRLGRRLAFDGVVLAVYALAANPVITGIPLHEYAGLGALVVLATHCALRGAFRGRPGSVVLNGLLLLTMALCVVSGVMVSGTVLPALGLYAEGYYFWDPLHALSAKLLLALLLIHVAVHLPRMIAALRSKSSSTLQT